MRIAIRKHLRDFLAIIFLCFKTLVVGLRELRDIPGTRAAVVWGMSVLLIRS